MWRRYVIIASTACIVLSLILGSVIELIATRPRVSAPAQGHLLRQNLAHQPAQELASAAESLILPLLDRDDHPAPTASASVSAGQP